MGQQTWASAAGEVWRAARRHRLVSAIVALCVAGSLIGIALAASGSAAPAADPAAPAFSLPVLGDSGQQISLGDYTGKPLIVNFFASWCGPCKQETPLLARFYRAEHGKVALVGLDENDVRSNALSFIHGHSVTYPVGWDPQVIAASAYGVAALPQTFFLNASHHVVDRVFGALTPSTLSRGVALATGSQGLGNQRRGQAAVFLDLLATPASPVRPYTAPPCHRPLSTPPMMPPPVTMESTNTSAAQAMAGTTAKRHGLLLAQRMARLGRARHRAPAAATTKNATAPIASEPLRAPTPRLAPMTCRPRSPAATTPPVTTAAPHGAPDMAAPEIDISSRRERSCSLCVGADIRVPCPSSTKHDIHVISRLCRRVPRHHA
jgi:cytochrome c biogenesis protein CcmG, thiol:disulfide interchange protein DsbE